LTNFTLTNPGEAPRPAAVEVHEGRITRVMSPCEAPPDALDLGGKQVWPGLIDLQVNGAGGGDVMNGAQDELSLISATLAIDGVTSFIATAITAPLEVIESALGAIAAYMRGHEGESDNVQLGAQMLGGHLEGPYISTEKRGAHPPMHIRPPNHMELERITAPIRPYLRMLTLAPELPNAHECIRWATREGIVVSAGHTQATPGDLSAAIQVGLKTVTHLYNGMLGFHHRQPGTVGGALTIEALAPMMIADGVHVGREGVQIAAGCIGPERLTLVSDAVAAMRGPGGEFEFGEDRAFATGNAVRRADGKLSGSRVPILIGLLNLMEFTGWPLETALKTVTINPARLIGIDARKGKIAPGYDADLIVLDDARHVEATMVRGRWVFTEFQF
jgi:N-acetylglucosamine-6-phosphate deacetylase